MSQMMLNMEDLSNEEQNAVQELKNRVKNDLTSPALMEDATLCYRFLKARDFDVGKAEKMLRKHIDWRKVYQVDKILEVFQPKEVFVKYIEPCLMGFDKDGDIIKYAKTGKINNTELMKCFKFHDYMKHWVWFAEKNASSMEQQTKKTGKMTSLSFILDLDGLEFANATSRISSQIFLYITHLLQDNYPERMKSVYVINAPSFYIFVYSIVKAVMSNAMVRKIHVFGYSGWKEKLLDVINADVLPAFLGGKRTDPDGDPYCKSFIIFPGKISESYYLSEEERFFTDPTEVSAVVIRPSEKREIFVHVKEVGSFIGWRFMVRGKAIGFGLFFQESQKVMKEIIPMYEYDTSDGTEEGSYRCFCKGKYIVIFDNSSSWFSTKEVQYVITVEKPEV